MGLVSHDPILIEGTMSTIANPVESSGRDRPAEPLSDRELATVSGGKGKTTLTPIVIVKHYDKASPILI